MSPPPKKVVFTTPLPPGDVVMLTAAVRDLHMTHPGRFVTDVRTSHPDLWRFNPYITPLDETGDGVEVLACHYPAIDESKSAPIHFLRGYTDYIADHFGIKIKTHVFGGDIHLSGHERTARRPITDYRDEEKPYWLVISGGKYDFSVKWWDVARYQEVVNHFEGDLDFVQVGNDGDFQPPLENVVDLRGKTTLRELVRWVYHADGVLCPITLLMHLAAAVEAAPGKRGRRPCVVVAGGREQPSWVSYPNHQFLHTVGMLDCCAETGCWKARVIPLNDGRSRLDQPGSLCEMVIDQRLPMCMNMIEASDVIRGISRYQRIQKTGCDGHNQTKTEG